MRERERESALIISRKVSIYRQEMGSKKEEEGENVNFWVKKGNKSWQRKILI